MKKASIVIVAAALTASHALAADAQVERGKVVFEHWCTPCHGGGHGHPGTSALQEKYHGDVPAELEKRKDLEPNMIHYFVRTGVSTMPFFRKTEITPAEEQDLIAYLARHAK